MHAARRIGFALAVAVAFATAPAGGASAAMPRAEQAEANSQGVNDVVTWKKKYKWRHGKGHGYKGRTYRKYHYKKNYHYRKRWHGKDYWHRKKWYKKRGYRKLGSPIPYGYTYVRPTPRAYIYRYHPYVYDRPVVRIRPFTRGWYGRRVGGHGYRW